MDGMYEDGGGLQQEENCTETNPGSNKRVSGVHNRHLHKQEDNRTKTCDNMDSEHPNDGSDETPPLSRTQSEELDSHALDSDTGDTQDVDSDKSDGDLNMCRICYGGSEEESLCSPCKCTGSIGFVHQSCMFHWIGGRPRMFCEICKHKYTIKRTTKAFLQVRLDHLDYYAWWWGWW